MKFNIIFISLLITAFKTEAQTSALSMADSLYAVGNYSEAIPLLEKLQPKPTEALLRLAKTYSALGNTPVALKNYELVLKRDSTRVVTAVAYARLLSANGELAKADSIFRNLIKKYPNSANFYYQLGLVKEKQRDSTAIKFYEFTLLLKENHVNALGKVAKNELAKGSTSRAIQLCKRGLAVNPNNISLLSLLAQAYYHSKDFGLAAQIFEKLVSLGSDSEFVQSKLGSAYFQLQQIDKAVEHFEKALNYNEMNPATHFNLGKLYAFQQKYELSERFLLQAIILKTQVLDAEYTSLGLTYKLQQEPKKAFDAFNKALKENPDNERAMYERAIAADSYFKDLETRLNYYEIFLEHFKESGSAELRALAQRRAQDIKEEMHMK